MTQTACDPAREPVSLVSREAAHLFAEPQSVMRPAGAAHLYETIDDPRIRCRRIREPNRLRITRRGEHAAARHQAAEPCTGTWWFPPSISRAREFTRALGCKPL